MRPAGLFTKRLLCLLSYITRKTLRMVTDPLPSRETGPLACGVSHHRTCRVCLTGSCVVQLALISSCREYVALAVRRQP